MRRDFFPRYALLLILVAFVVVADEPVRDKRWAVPVEIAGVENLHRVDEGLYRSGQPTGEGFKNLYDYGIRVVLSLRSNHDDRTLAGNDTQLELLCVPMAAWFISDQDIIAALRILRSRDPKKPLLVHCWHGADRTGAVIAAYRIVCQNWTVSDAIREMQEGGFGYHSLFQNISTYLEKMNIEKIRTESAP
ncbi:MAG: dual specificity protein phosphatase family protein [Lentisphaerae bacterium]|nr:dual specificity protein phosphatase family protein [Lentisphaerota bacterium]